MKKKNLIKKLVVLNMLDLKFNDKIKKIYLKNFQFKNIFNKIDLKKSILNSNIILSHPKLVLDENLIKKAKNLKIIASPSTGTDHLDLNAIRKKKIKLFTIKNEKKILNNFTATSELSFLLLLSFIRKFDLVTNDIKKGVWSRELNYGEQLKNKTMGIIGYGRLGKISSKIAHGFGMRVLAYDKKKFISKKNIKFVSKNFLLRNSDFINIHIHLTKETENFISFKDFKLMKKSCFIINTSRGKIINERDLLKALKKKMIAGAGLDVINGEWLSPKDLKNHILIKYAKKNRNLIITPHVGGSTVDSIKLARDFIMKKVLLFVKKKKIL